VLGGAGAGARMVSHKEAALVSVTESVRAGLQVVRGSQSDPGASGTGVGMPAVPL